ICMERNLLLLEDLGKLTNKDNACDVFIILHSAQLHQSLAIVENIRQELPQIKIDMDIKFGSFKSLFKKADNSGAKVAII
ncbi:histidine--tRNA ligase, partial [Francisella tularensis subsp. holarctica]|nr:histidine--tRNA ligase [Francisella tularensis subsp. holarctica]